MEFRVSAQVESELDDIWLYIAMESASINVADRVVDSITQQFFLLSKHPYSGRRRDDLRAGLRSVTVGATSSFIRLKETTF
jgi:plasmid stabilization system protein ParE